MSFPTPNTSQVFSPFPLETKIAYIHRIINDPYVQETVKQPKYRMSTALNNWEKFKAMAIVVINTSLDSEYFIRENDALRKTPIALVPNSAKLEKEGAYLPTTY